MDAFAQHKSFNGRTRLRALWGGSYRCVASLLAVSMVCHTGCGRLYQLEMETRSPRYGLDLPIPFSEIIATDDSSWKEYLGDSGYRVAAEEIVHLNYVDNDEALDAQAIVYIHGNSGSIDEIYHAKLQHRSDSTTLFEHLGKKYRVIAIDRPGHGYSDRCRADYPWQQVSVLRAALQKLNVTRPILVGHSWGGALALLYAIRWKDDVAGLVLLAPVVDGPKYKLIPCAEFLSGFSGPAFFWTGTAITRGSVQKGLREAYFGEKYQVGQNIPDWDSEHARRAINLWTRSGQLVDAAKDDCNLKNYLTRCPPDYRLVAAPIRILTGERDSDVKREEHADKLLDALGKKQVRLCELPSPCAHMITLTNAADVNVAIDKLATQIRPP